MKFPRFSLAFLFCLSAVIAHADVTRVAVLVDDALPVLSGAPALPPFQAAAALRRHGIPATELSAADLDSPEKLNASQFRVLVLWNGNAFPQAALANLRVFHAAGGSLVLNGVPFTHACELRAGKWHDHGHGAAYRHDASGMGTGGFGGPGKAAAPFLLPTDNPLALRPGMLPAGDAKVQWFEPGKFPDRGHLHADRRSRNRRWKSARGGGDRSSRMR